MFSHQSEYVGVREVMATKITEGLVTLQMLEFVFEHFMIIREKQWLEH